MSVTAVDPFPLPLPRSDAKYVLSDEPFPADRTSMALVLSNADPPPLPNKSAARASMVLALPKAPSDISAGTSAMKKRRPTELRNICTRRPP
jgi:hypothetical protein